MTHFPWLHLVGKETDVDPGALMRVGMSVRHSQVVQHGRAVRRVAEEARRSGKPLEAAISRVVLRLEVLAQFGASPARNRGRIGFDGPGHGRSILLLDVLSMRPSKSTLSLFGVG